MNFSEHNFPGLYYLENKSKLGLPWKPRVNIKKVLCPQGVVTCTVFNHSEAAERILEIQSKVYNRLNVPHLKNAFIILYIKQVISYVCGCCRSNFIIKNIKLADQTAGF